MKVKYLNPKSCIADLWCFENMEQFQNFFAAGVEISKWSEATNLPQKNAACTDILGDCPAALIYTQIILTTK